MCAQPDNTAPATARLIANNEISVDRFEIVARLSLSNIWSQHEITI